MIHISTSVLFTLSVLVACTGGSGDAGNDASTFAVDADLNAPDADPNAPDADLNTPDANGGGGVETMTITFASEPVGGSAYAPTNVVATWIETANGAFVQTINRQSAARTQHLVAWTQNSGGQEVDQYAVTGPTRLNHNSPVIATWTIPAALPDGIYTVRIETSDDNSTTAEQDTQGVFTFERDGTASTQIPADPGYSGVTVDYSGR
ncbi:MAG: DUF2271 domain-containing protein [Myxococcales bacterium]|nr:DUF2271 domain-containing protein [Myxococcales bacterium]